MQYQQLGKSSMQISRIGFGCMSLKPGQEDLYYLVNKAIEGGITYFDTADLYDRGLNEINIGKAVKNKRNKIILATKGGNEWISGEEGWNWNPSKSYLLKAVENSLERLQTDYIDLYQLHGGTINDNIDEVIEAFELMQQQGKIRYYGISSIRPNVIKEYVNKSSMVSVMIQYSLLDRRSEEVCLPLLQENNIGVLARGVLAKGVLVDKHATAYLNYDERQVYAASKVIKEIAGNRSNSSIAIQFALQNTAVTSAIIGIRTSQQLEDVLQSSIDVKLSADEMKALQLSIPLNYYEQHR
ncbi:aldo/keto reductase [Ferruginibacter albus]|uniref:aldo/keto reductase n=1 Tax=Ferruginibacter albus TaxID=2875540 RepID=UPI001CC48BFC|nr:aldo/keto reductase [Ferruginibacter albus]UAY52781.1 aldo/keto reductase [Ferruginibacter albus]